MKRYRSIRFKAVFLLIVFALSTLVSFACAAGLDMGYNKDHHKIQDTASSTEHPEINHNHSQNARHEHSSADTKKLNSHKDEIAHHDTKDLDTKESTPDDCCRDEAAKFEKCDKLSPKVFNHKLQAPFITLIVNRYLIANPITTSLHNPSTRYYIRNHHPPIADTRIAIQSFLI